MYGVECNLGCNNFIENIVVFMLQIGKGNITMNAMIKGDITLDSNFMQDTFTLK